MPDIRKKKFKHPLAAAAGDAMMKVIGGPADMLQKQSESVESMGETVIRLAKDPSSHPRHVNQKPAVPKDAKPQIVVKPLKRYKKPEG
jgi:hypothetical protein